MTHIQMPRRRRLGNWFLGLAGLLLVAGETVFKPWLGKSLLFLSYWGACFFFTFLALGVAAMDFIIVRRSAHSEHKALIENAIQDGDNNSTSHPGGAQ